MREKMLTIDVFDAADFTVVDGVLAGDPLGHAAELVLDDLYQLAGQADALRMELAVSDAGLRRIGAAAGQRLHLDCCLTFMGADGGTHDGLVLVEETAGQIGAIYFMALGDIAPEQPYRLVGVTRQTAIRRFAESQAASFARGTRITMADGRMRAIETLAPGDLILTRDAGVQPLRHIAQTTLRATGRCAPVVLPQGALHNAGDLVLHPDHRIFVYQRSDRLGAGRAEVLIKARQLVDGTQIYRRQGGFVDYFQLVLDQHHIIYAEGIAAESSLVDAASRPALPAAAHATDHAHRPHLDYDVSDRLIDPQTVARLLRGG